MNAPPALPVESASRWVDWWTRACGGREVIRLALPLMISTLSYSLMQFCDRVFLAWHSPTSLAAVMPAGVMAWTIMSFPFGVALYTNVFVAQYHGARQDARIGSVIWHELILASMFVPLFLTSVIWPHWIFELAGHREEIAREEALYFRYISIGSIAHVYGGVFSSFFIGTGRTRIVMVVDVAVAVLNVLLDWVLIFGLTAGTTVVIPELGIQGAALATTAALLVKMLVFAGLFLGPANRERYGLLRTFRYHGQLVMRMIRFGSSNGLQFLIECLGIAVFSLMIAGLGEVPAAATTVAISVNMMVFVPVWGLSTAVSTMVGQQIGEGQPHLAERATWTGLLAGLAYTGFFAFLYLVTPQLFLWSHHAGAGNFQEISRVARWLLVFVAAYCIFDTIQIVFVAAIKGAGDTSFVVVTSLVCAALFVAFGWSGYRLFESTSARLYWWWLALTGWIVLLSLVYGLRFLQGRWKSMQVIEQELIAGTDHDRSGAGGE
jgi:MATE family multidrug resistance protein